jgi:hypothetical protein
MTKLWKPCPGRDGYTTLTRRRSLKTLSRTPTTGYRTENPEKLCPDRQRWVPHISLVFREMWDTTNLHVTCQQSGKFTSGTIQVCAVGPRTDPDFLRATLERSAYAAFFTESRTRLLGSTKLHRKSGYRPGAFSVVPAGLVSWNVHPGLTSWATLSRPFGNDRDTNLDKPDFQPSLRD